MECYAYANGIRTDRLNNAGGYVNNERGSIRYTRSMDIKDGQLGLLKALEKDYMTTQSKFDFSQRSELSNGHYSGSVFPGITGYSRPRMLHGASQADLNCTKRAQISDSQNTNAQFTKQCLVPEDILTETRDQFNIRSTRQPEWNQKLWYAEAIGSRTTGYSQSISPYWAVQGKVVDPSYAHNTRVTPHVVSVSRFDFQPYEKRTGYEPIPPIGTKGKSVTGFTTIKETTPCFLPMTKIYGELQPVYNEPKKWLMSGCNL